MRDEALALEIVTVLKDAEAFIAREVAAKVGATPGRDGGRFSRALRVALDHLHGIGITFRSEGKGGRYRRGDWADAEINAKRTRRRGLRAVARALCRLPELAAVPEDQRPRMQKLAERYSCVHASYQLEEAREKLTERQMVRVPLLGEKQRP